MIVHLNSEQTLFIHVVDQRTNVTHSLRILLEAKGREILQSLVADDADLRLFHMDHGFLDLDTQLSLQGISNGDILMSSGRIRFEL